MNLLASRSTHRGASTLPLSPFLLSGAPLFLLLPCLFCGPPRPFTHLMICWKFAQIFSITLTVKIYSSSTVRIHSQINKGKNASGRVRRNPCPVFPCLFPPVKGCTHTAHSPSSKNASARVPYDCSGKAVIPNSGCSLGADHRDTQATKTADSQTETGGSL